MCTSLPKNMSVYVFGLPSVPLLRPSELFSRSLATLIMSGPPQSINQPSAAPLNPQTGAQGSVRVCVRVRWAEAEAELFKGFNLQWISAVNTVIPVISAISSKTSARMSKEVSVVCLCVKIPFSRVLTSEPTHVREGSVHRSRALIPSLSLISCNPVHVSV